MIDDKVMWMSKISFENVIMIKSFQIWLKNNYENDMEKMMCYYKQCGHTIILQWLMTFLTWVQMDIINYKM
jgi:hypothetical protein